ncbi:cytochrome b/b6 domain-containing protein [Roseivivax isoporae]|uniref:Cytochrome n=1 Tax=Roseivivax isoporae LMG 25204 TaxID=1449351 RepID=X7FD53_9RHOB|nr:cytochrome b/b6 domain-containing protein [Roseivivax isoporae]ETX30673.1 cytochrome [Roseivivax isoporae LMG 25204]
MPATNAADRYGAVAKTFHWLIALGILAMLPLGFVADLWPSDTSGAVAVKTTLFSIHKTLGTTLFALALLRILWALTQPKPVPLHPERRAETLAADTVHWLLYGSLVLVPLTGWVGHAASEGFAPIWGPVGQSLPFVPKSPALAETAWTLHFIFIWVLIAALGLHVAGALKHHLVDGDATLRRMLPGATRAGTATGHGHRTATPVVLAVAFWAVALGAGAGAGLFRQEAGAAEPPTLAAADSDWQVTEGTLAISVVQMGSEIEGRFADWTASIAFEERGAPGTAGEVEVQIAVPSLTLGSVSEQAKGADFLAASEFPTATYAGDIVRVADGYEVQGTLTLKGEEVPVTLPFQLTLEDGTARVEGTTTLDRRNYGIGRNMEDESQVGFEVRVRVELTATRTE